MHKYRHIPTLTALAVFFVLIGGLLYIADWPPPRGFVWMLVCVALLAALTWWRMPVWAGWIAARKPARAGRALAEGCAAGLVAALALMSGGQGEPGIPAIGGGDMLIWLVVLALCGTGAAALIYGITARFMGAPSSKR